MNSGKRKDEGCGNLLIVDDDENVRQCLAYIASLDGWTADTCDQFENCIRRIRQKQIDVLLVDYHMPPINGLELISHLHRSGIQIPMLLISAHSPLIDRAKAHNLGVHKILPKPPDLHEFREALKSARRQISTIKPS